MTLEDIIRLSGAGIRQAIERHIDGDPARIALSAKEDGALISTQVKYLQRARAKLPSYYAARCIIPPLAYEQSSSEESAAAKHYTGETCIDLTCGLGVDSLHFSGCFKRVVSIERDEVLATAARYNFSRMGIQNIRVEHTSAEEYISALESEAGASELRLPVDLIYIDPARRGKENQKLFLLQDCSPDTVSLMPRLLQLARRVVVKASPLFDVEEAFRLFGPHITVEVVSVRGECKEVLIEVSRPEASEGTIKATVAGGGTLVFPRGAKAESGEDEPEEHLPTPLEESNRTAEERRAWQVNEVSKTGAGTPGKVSEVNKAAWVGEESAGEFARFRYLLIPDVTLYKVRLVQLYARQLGVYAPSETGYCFAETAPESFFGRVFRIESIAPYQPKALKKRLKQQGVTRLNILKKDFPMDADGIAKALGIKQGGTNYAVFTRIKGRSCIIMISHYDKTEK